MVCVGSHAPNAPSSIRHSRVAPDSSASRPKVGVASRVTPVGPEAMVVCGAAVSTVMARVAGVGSGFPAASTARTSSVWSPSPSGSGVDGEEQGAKAPSSKRHSRVAPDSPASKPKVGVASAVRPAGPLVIAVSGGSISTVKVREAGATLECRFDDGAFAPCSSPSTPEPPAASSTPTPPASSEAGVGGTACSDGRDNDGDGVADAQDPGCLSSASGGYASGDGSEVDDLAQLPGTQLALRCAGARLRLIDVRAASGGKVALRGAAQPRYAGKRVTLSLTSTHTNVATTTVAGDGSFNATVKAPRRSQRAGARYEAAIGGVRSRATKLAHRAAITSAAVRRGRVTLSGQIVRPLARPVAPVVITRQVGCGRSAAVARVRPRSNGSFRITVPAPSGVRAVMFRARTQVHRTASSRRLSNTFSLPMPVDLR